jgi:outer membrane receptor protein involved in Fe transport
MMTKPLAYGTLLLLTSTLVTPAALAQTASGGGGTSSTPAMSSAPATPAAADPQSAAQVEEDVEISTPGGANRPSAAPTQEGDIVVTGRYIPNVVRNTSQVLSVLSQADIARTGEGDIAGALQRVTGLSLVGNGFVYVRGLGDRYSSSLLNGSPLPSPEPLRRVVPLDIFPTSIVASALVQKSYSVNYPGEFGGGVINLTTRAVPEKTTFAFGTSLGVDTETTGRLGYTYYGSDTDFLGYDDGERNVPQAIKDAGRGGTSLGSNDILNLSNARTTLLRRNTDVPANFSADMNFGTAKDIDDGRIGMVLSGGYDNSWRTRNAIQQATDDQQGNPQRDFRTVLTDNRTIVNGLLGFGAELGDHRVRFTNVYIHDTLKQGRLGAGTDVNIAGVPGIPTLIEQNTNFFERQLITTQGVGEFKFGDFGVDLRGSYANTFRKSPYERAFVYQYDNVLAKDYVNNLSGTQSATVAFSDLNEDLWSGAADLSYKITGATPIRLSAGYAYNDTDRTSSRFTFRYIGPNAAPLNQTVSQLRPDYLLSDAIIQQYGITLQNTSTAQGAAEYDASLRVHAGYAQVEAEASSTLRATAGVRYETALETVNPIGATALPTRLDNNYWLPAATVTWNFVPDMQLRLHGSKTLARPQFRELAAQIYQDFESDRQFIGNPLLVDSQLYNAEARYEWFFGRDQRFSAAGFFKKIKNPVEAIATFTSDGRLQTGFSNAPEAQLYGGEVEFQKYVPLDGFGGPFFETRRLVLVANYSYTKSKLKVGDEQVPDPIQSSATPRLQAANLLFRDGAPLVGQSDHLVNFQLGLEDTAKLSQVTLLVNYASDRVTNRGPVSSGVRLPDLVERPGVKLDLVVRQGFDFYGAQLEFKAEGRNLLRTNYRESQDFGDRRILINQYDLGRVFSLGVGVKL